MRSKANQIKPRPGVNEEFGFETYSGSIESIQVNKNKEFTDADYIAALKRLRDIISNSPLKAEDSNFPGNKYTECNWGLCSDEVKLWPEAKMHIWPYEFINHDRVAPIRNSSSVGQYCPQDIRADMPEVPESDKGQGCFYYCRVFKRKLKTPTREQSIAKIDELITRSNNAKI